MAYINPHNLVDTDWLASHLAEPNLRIYDCTTHLIHQNDPALPGPFRVQSRLEEYLQEHIPGAAFIDLQEDVADPDRNLGCPCPNGSQLLSEFAAVGVGDKSQVVL